MVATSRSWCTVRADWKEDQLSIPVLQPSVWTWLEPSTTSTWCSHTPSSIETSAVLTFSLIHFQTISGKLKSLISYSSVSLLRELCTVGPGNPVYEAPELGSQCPSQAVHFLKWTSSALELVEMLTNKFPAVEAWQQLIHSINHDKFVHLIGSCSREEMEERPSADEIIDKMCTICHWLSVTMLIIIIVIHVSVQCQVATAIINWNTIQKFEFTSYMQETCRIGQNFLYISLICIKCCPILC